MLSNIKLQWHYFLLALGFFTRIPVPGLDNFQSTDLNHSTKYFPLIGILVGSVGALSFYLTNMVLPQTIAVLISMVSTIYLTGAFHEDGLADSADGLGGGWQRDQILIIMQDSRLGTYGTVALLLMLFAKFQILDSFDRDLILFGLIAGHAISRLCAVWLMTTLSYVKPEGKAKPLATEISLPALCFASVTGLLLHLGFTVIFIINKHTTASTVIFVLMTLTPMVLSGLWWRHKIKKWLGGYTGDTLGAMQQITELAFYLGLLLWSFNT